MCILIKIDYSMRVLALLAVGDQSANLQGQDDAHYKARHEGYQVLQARRAERREVHSEGAVMHL